MSRFGFRILFVFLIVGCGFFAGCRDRSADIDGSFAYDETLGEGTVSVSVRLDLLEVSIADTANLEIEVLADKGCEVVFPDLSRTLEDFDIIDESIEMDRLGEDDRIIKLRKYRLEPMITGDAALPALSFEYVAKGSEEAETVETAEIIVKVASVLGDAAQEATVADIEDVVVMQDYSALIWVLAITAGVVILAAAVVIKRKRSKLLVDERILKAAHEIALERLKTLQDSDLASSGRLKVFYEQVSNILRYYIEDRFTLKAPERTTEEFLAELKYDYVLSAGDKESLEQFLRHCDLVKFAKHQPTDQQVKLTVDLVKDFIDRTKSGECLIDVTDNTNDTESVA